MCDEEEENLREEETLYRFLNSHVLDTVQRT
jgi:hypothetical protein